MNSKELKELSQVLGSDNLKTHATLSEYVLMKIGKWQIEGYIKDDYLKIVISDGYVTDFPIYYGDGKTAFDFGWDKNSEIVKRVNQLYFENNEGV